MPDSKCPSDAERCSEVARKSWEKRAPLIHNRFEQNRNWVSVAEVVDFLARERGNVVPSTRRAESAYDQIAESLGDGEFNCRGKSQMVRLDPKSPRIRMKADDLELVADLYDTNTRNAQYLNYCWLPREIWRKWFAKLNLDWPAHFNALNHDSDAPTVVAASQAARGQPVAEETVITEIPRRRGRPKNANNELEHDIQKVLHVAVTEYPRRPKGLSFAKMASHLANLESIRGTTRYGGTCPTRLRESLSGNYSPNEAARYLITICVKRAFLRIAIRTHGKYWNFHACKG